MLRKTITDKTSVAPTEATKATEQVQFMKKAPESKWDKILNIAIGILSVVVVVLIVSLIVRLNSSGEPKTEQVNEISDGTTTVDQTQQLKSQTIRVEILNGTNVPRLASKAADYLRAKGFDVVQTGNAQHSNFKKSVVQDRMGNMQNALSVASTLGIAESGVIQQKNPQLYVEVTVILGNDYKLLKFMSSSN